MIDAFPDPPRCAECGRPLRNRTSQGGTMCKQCGVLIDRELRSARLARRRSAKFRAIEDANGTLILDLGIAILDDGKTYPQRKCINREELREIAVARRAQGMPWIHDGHGHWRVPDDQMRHEQRWHIRYGHVCSKCLLPLARKAMAETVCELCVSDGAKLMARDSLEQQYACGDGG